jgi:hypothetical protein
MEERLIRRRRSASPLRALPGAAVFSCLIGALAIAWYAPRAMLGDCTDSSGGVWIGSTSLDEKMAAMSERDDQSVSESEEGMPNGTLGAGRYRVQILEILESWPLQLRVSFGAGEYIVELSPEAELIRGGESISPGELSGDQEVELLIEGHRVSHLNVLD